MNCKLSVGGAVFFAILLSAPYLASAQFTQQPPGSTGGIFGGHRPVDPNRTSQTLALTLDLSGGYDQNVATDDGESLPNLNGQATTASAAMRYWRGRTGRSIEGNWRAFINHQQGVDAGQLLGGAATVRGAVQFGRRTGADANLDLAYEPTFLFSGFGNLLGPIEGEPAPPDVAPPQGVIQQRWLTAQGSASVFRNWTSRQRLDIRFNLMHRQPTEGEGLNSRTISTVATHAWSLRRYAALQFSYGFSENRQGEQVGAGLPLRTHTAQAGVRLERRVAPERSLVLSATGGSTYARIERVGGPAEEYFVPTISTSARLDVSRTWNVAADFNGYVTILEGLTPEPFTGDVAGLRLAGQAGSRVSLSLAGAYSRGQALVTRTGAYESLAGTASVQVTIARWCSAFSSYSYYQHRTTDVATLPTGFPPRYDRNSVRVGLTVWLPLFGTF